MRPYLLGILPLAAAAALLAGCQSTPIAPAPAAPVETRAATPAPAARAQQPAATAAGTPQSRVTNVDVAKNPINTGAAAGAAIVAAPSQRLVFFDFDSYVIKDEFKAMLDGHAKALTSNKARRMVVEGHTDERGGSEYNLALGQKRAEAVLKSLTLLGAGEQQLEAVSFGKERPLVNESNEAAWAKNRRAELKDR